MRKTHKIALRPNRVQTAGFSQQCGYARFAYNAALADFKTALSSEDRDVNAAINLRHVAVGYTEA